MKETQLPRFEMRAIGAPSDRTWFCVACVGPLNNWCVFAFLEPEEANADAARLERQGNTDTLYRFCVTANVEKDATEVQVYAARVLETMRERGTLEPSAVTTDESGALRFKVPNVDNEGRTVTPAFDYWKAHEAAQKLSARGGFAGCLSDAFFRADKRNAERLARAFPELFGDA